MHPAKRPWWQQATALVSLSATGAITGFSFAPKAAADVRSPSNLQIRLLALRQAAKPAAVDDATLRSAIVNVAQYYLRMAAGKTPAEMEELIWQHDSIDGVDHGESCAAFASLTLELAAQVVGQDSWVTGGTSYPWPLHEWADVRVDPNPASLGITSLLQDAEAHHRWHPLGSGYEPLPGDWVLFDGHVEVVTKYAGGDLSTIGGDSLPNFSVNAHEYRGPLGADGVAGFVNNGELPGATSNAPAGHAAGGQQTGEKAAPAKAAAPDTAAGGAAAGSAAPAGARAVASPQPTRTRASGDAAIPGMPQAASSSRPSRGKRPAPVDAGRGQQRASTGSTPASKLPVSKAPVSNTPAGSAPGSNAPGSNARGGKAAAPASVPRADRARSARTPQASAQDASAIPGLPAAAAGPAAGATTPSAAATAPSAAPYGRHRPSVPATPVQDTAAQQAFIGEVVPGAVAVQRRYGVPASVTIAQAIDESGWGRSSLATEDHNLFGIKGTGPAGSDAQPTHEFENGQSVMRTASFRVYHNAAESIDDHGKLLATSEYYRQPMAYRHDPNALAAALTGVYATDPDYGAKLILLMRRYDLYHYDDVAPAVTHSGASHSATAPGAATPRGSVPAGSSIPGLPDGSTAQTVSTSPARAASEPAPARAQAHAHAHPVPHPRAASTAPDVSQQSGAFETLSAVHLSAPAERQTPRTQIPRSQVPRAQTPRAQTPRAPARAARARVSPYQPHIPPSVTNSFVTTARVRLAGEEPLYRDVASHSGIRWELLAACDWMQCEAQGRFSPVHGEKLGTANPDGTIYRTKSEALEQCADDLVALARAVYGIELTAQRNLSVRDLANVFAAFRWGGLLRLHRTSAMEFPYSVAGLTVGHLNMRWPNIDDPNTPDKPGGRFRKPFGAVPIVLGLKYPATV
jgi:flagellum-specific peptidoglycan hydrolase FlgJ